jgi:hypothetical protein
MSASFYVLLSDLNEVCIDIKLNRHISPFSVIFIMHRLNIIERMLLDLPNLEQWINSIGLIDTTKSITHAEKIDKYKSALGGMFHNWTNVLTAYRSCGYLEKCPRWFVDYYMKTYPNSHSDSKLVAEYYTLVNS